MLQPRLAILYLYDRVSTVKQDGSQFKAYTRVNKFEGLRVTFNIEKDRTPESNKATIKIYNLSEKHRNALNAPKVKIGLSVGRSLPLESIYRGDIVRADHKKEGPNWVSTILCGTGHNQLKYGRLPKTFKIGADPRSIYKSLFASMGLKIPKTLDDAKAIFSDKGITMSGVSSRDLTRILGVQGYDWSIQDGGAQVMKKGDSNGAPSVVVDKAYGLIGTPVSLKEKADNKVLNKTRFDYTLSSVMSPGQLVSVFSSTVKGNYVISKVNHVGDTHGKPWYSKCEATQLR